jgi:hypothetical protein
MLDQLKEKNKSLETSQKPWKIYVVIMYSKSGADTVEESTEKHASNGYSIQSVNGTNAMPETDLAPIPLQQIPRVTSKQEKCLRETYRFAMGHRYYPTAEELSKLLGLASRSAQHLQKELASKGFLTKRSRTSPFEVTLRGAELLKSVGVIPAEQLELFNKNKLVHQNSAVTKGGES